MKTVIYETKGRAREFNELAINLFTGCGHQCIYCYGADVTHQDKAQFKNNPRPRVTPQDIERSATEMVQRGDKRRVLLCFVTDPYQPIEAETKLTRTTIEILHHYGLGVIILTKGGWRSMRDFDLLGKQDAYATTLTLWNAAETLIWEPGAASPLQRTDALREAYNRGIETWVSFEPVIYPEETFTLLELTFPWVGHYKVGTMNYHPQGKSTDWKAFGFAMKGLMDRMGVKYYFKKDLLREMGLEPDKFKQTFICR